MIAILTLVACAQPLHMQYDFGRAYRDSVELQAQLDRPGAAQAQYMLQGAEAVDMRKAVRDITTGKTEDSIKATVLK